MKTLSISSYFVLILFLQSCLLGASAKISYDGLVLTTIDVYPVECDPVEGEPIRVRFSGSKSCRMNNKKATFLKNITQINDIDKDGERLFEADLVNITSAKRIINYRKKGEHKPLFCIHGFNVHPGSHLKDCQKNAKKFNQGKFILVPVIWPSRGDITKYTDDQKLAEAAGEAFKTAYEMLKEFKSKSLLAHSMGNLLLRYASDKKFKFDNIFMVAADIRHDLFHRSYIESSTKDKKKHGLNLAGMLSTYAPDKPKGKIYILHNRADFALFASVGANKLRGRLGRFGYDKKFTLGGWREKKKLVHPDITEEHIENIDFNPYLPFNKKASHSYQFASKAVKIYQDKYI